MATARRMPQNIDILDTLTEKIVQNGNTTEIGGNVEIDGNLQVNGSIKQGSNTLLTSGNVKTLFGNQSIVGTGNIDLYQHNIKFLSTEKITQGGTEQYVLEIYLVIYSSKNLKVDSLTDLKTLLGNTFETPAVGCYRTGSASRWQIGLITETNAIAILTKTTYPYPAGTWSDTVTTV